MKFRVSIQIVSEDEKFSNTIYSHSGVSEKQANQLAQIVRKLFYMVRDWKHEAER